MPWSGESPVVRDELDTLAKHFEFSLDTPFRNFPASESADLLHGSGEEEELRFYTGIGAAEGSSIRRPFEGVLNQLDRRYKETTRCTSAWNRSRYINLRDCPTCEGARLKKESLAVRVAVKIIGRGLPDADPRVRSTFLMAIPLTPREAQVTERVMENPPAAPLPPRRRHGLPEP